MMQRVCNLWHVAMALQADSIRVSAGHDNDTPSKYVSEKLCGVNCTRVDTGVSLDLTSGS
jgi:hypothetical protein